VNLALLNPRAISRRLQLLYRLYELLSRMKSSDIYKAQSNGPTILALPTDEEHVPLLFDIFRRAVTSVSIRHSSNQVLKG
jgi:hypothetical protein